MAVAIHRPFYNMPAAAAGIGTQVVADDFNRADQNPIAGNWTPETGANTFKILTNALTTDNTAQDCTAFYNAWASGNNQYSQAGITVSGTGSGSGPGVCVRRSTTIGTLTYYRLTINSAGGIELGTVIAGTYAALTTRSVTYGAAKKLGLGVNGTTLKIWYDGVQQGADVTNSDIASGSPGVAYSSVSTSLTLDNWDAGTT